MNFFNQTYHHIEKNANVGCFSTNLYCNLCTIWSSNYLKLYNYLPYKERRKYSNVGSSCSCIWLLFSLQQKQHSLLKSYIKIHGEDKKKISRNQILFFSEWSSPCELQQLSTTGQPINLLNQKFPLLKGPEFPFVFFFSISHFFLCCFGFSISLHFSPPKE